MIKVSCNNTNDKGQKRRRAEKLLLFSVLYGYFFSYHDGSLKKIDSSIKTKLGFAKGCTHTSVQRVNGGLPSGRREFYH